MNESAVFSKSLPTEPGYYLWRKHSLFDELVFKVELAWAGNQRILMAFNNDGDCESVESMKGEWCRLMPITKAKKQTKKNQQLHS